MHRILFIREILFNIFGHCSSPFGDIYRPDLAALARTCQTFKEPALDVLWEELPNLTLLACCLREACHKSKRWGYELSRPPNEAEWNTLRGYTRRVWSVRSFRSPDDCGMMDLWALASPTNPLFPNLRSLCWTNSTTFPVANAAVPSLTSLDLSLHFFDETLSEFLDAVGQRCPNMKSFTAYLYEPRHLDGVSRQLFRWTNLQHVYCGNVTLCTNTILRLPSMPTLEALSFTLGSDADNHTTHHGSAFVFPDLAILSIRSTSLKSVTSLFSRIQLTKIKSLAVFVAEYTPRRDVSAYWTAIQKACPSNTVTDLILSSSSDGMDNRTDFDGQRPWLTLDDLLPYKDFGNLREIYINIPWSVKLTDADVLDLVSTSPQLEELAINGDWGWRMDGAGGITLSGLVQLLRRCPFLYWVLLAIDARTFIRIPEGLDVSFPPRERLSIQYLDSYMVPWWTSGLDSVFDTLEVAEAFSFHDFD